jgi:hypothetical protein
MPASSDPRVPSTATENTPSMPAAMWTPAVVSASPDPEWPPRAQRRRGLLRERPDLRRQRPIRSMVIGGMDSEREAEGSRRPIAPAS